MIDRITMARSYREKAARCRRLAGQTTDLKIAARLLELADEFDKRAEQATNSED